MKDFFGAGSETTATTLGWALYFMIKYPDVPNNIRVSTWTVYYITDLEAVVGDQVSR